MNTTDQVYFWTPAHPDLHLSAYWQGGYYLSPVFHPMPRKWYFDSYFWHIECDKD
jgi:hypothetical protein